MITVLKGYKDGTRINRYECSNGEHTVMVTKEQLITYIKQGEVKNARIQNYKGSVIVRVENADVINSKEADDYEVPTELKKLLNIERFIRSYKDKGIDEIALGDAKINTDTLNITGFNTNIDNEKLNKTFTKIQVQDIVEKKFLNYRDLVYTNEYAYFVSSNQLYCMDLSSEKLEEVRIANKIEKLAFTYTDRGNVKIVVHNKGIFAFRFDVTTNGDDESSYDCDKLKLIWAKLDGADVVSYGEQLLCELKCLKRCNIDSIEILDEKYIICRFHAYSPASLCDFIEGVAVLNVEDNVLYHWKVMKEDFHIDSYLGTIMTGYRHESLELDSIDLLNIEETHDMIRLTLRNRYRDKLLNRLVSVYENNEKYIGSEDKYYTFKVNKNTGDVIVRLYSNTGDELDLSRSISSITYK